MGEENQQLVRSLFMGTCKAFDADTRTAEHPISSDALDRAGDVLALDGWDLKNFKRNPVVVADHSYSIKNIIGRGQVWLTSKYLMAKTEFADTELGKVAMDLVSTGFAGAWSVGCRPKDSHQLGAGAEAKCGRCQKAIRDGAPSWGRHYTAQELVEYSLVAVPMNADAVGYAVQRGLLPAQHVHTFVQSKESPEQGAPTAPVSDTETRDGAVQLVEVGPATARALEECLRTVGRHNLAVTMRELVAGFPTRSK